MTFLAALRHDRIEAPWLLDGAIDQASFHAYVEHVLAPTLGPGDLVVADNLAYHMSPAVRQAIRQTGARRQRERQMQRFKSARHAQHFLSTHSRPHPHHFQLRRYRLTADQHRAARDTAFRTWREMAGVAAVA